IRGTAATAPDFAALQPNRVRHHGFYAIGQIAGHRAPQSGMRLKERPVNRDCQLLFRSNVADAAQPVLPPLCDSDRIERSDIELDTWRRQIDAHPVDQAVPLFGCIQPFTTVSNALKDFSGDRELTAVLVHIAGAYQGMASQE